MAANTTTKLFAHARLQLLDKKTFAFHAFVLAAVLITVSALTGCGGSGSVSTQPVTGSASLAWDAPSTNADGTPLTDLTGYKVYYGTEPGVYQSINVGAVDSFEVTGLASGQTYYFTVTAYDSSGSESDYSDVVSELIS